MNTKYEISDLTTDLKIISIHEFNINVDKLFKMFSNPEYLKKWFWPKWFTNTFKKFDFKENGEWIFTMHWPDNGHNYENNCIFLKILENELIVWNHLSAPNFQIQVYFRRISDYKTKMEFIMIFDDKNIFEWVLKFAPEKNEENFEKIEKLIEQIY